MASTISFALVLVKMSPLMLPVPVTSIVPALVMLPPVNATPDSFSVLPPSTLTVPLSVIVPPVTVTPSSVTLSKTVSPAAVSVNVVPFTVTLSSVSVRPLSTVTPPLLRNAGVARPAPWIVLDPLISIVPPDWLVPSLIVPPVMVTLSSVRLLPPST